MPNIIIREHDRTTAGNSTYTNFTVVVPGYIKTDGRNDTATWVNGLPKEFDENGVFECSDLATFKKVVGVLSSNKVTVQEAVAPTYEEITDYTVPAAEGETNPTIYKLNRSEFSDVDSWVESVEFVAEAIATKSDGKERLYFGYPSGKNENGELQAGDIKFELTLKSESEPSMYAIIKEEEKGKSKIETTHYGNQIAYELLNLGYTVLYKAIAKKDAEENAALMLESYENFWASLADKAIYDFRYIVTGLLDSSITINNAMVSLAETRGDCIALIDIPTNEYIGASSQNSVIENISSWVKSLTSSKYAAIFAPTVTYTNVRSKKEYNNSTFPASFHYLACAAKASENYNEWYAIAGYNRGICEYTIDSVGYRLGEVAIEALEPRINNEKVDKAVNLIVKIKNNYYLWGNRTAALLDTPEASNPGLRASHFLNIRQLCNTIKKQVYTACRKFTFDPNSDVLWINFCNAIRPTLEKMKADQGISNYKIQKLKADKKALLAAIIRIVPIEAVEDFDISISLEDSIGGSIVGLNIEENEVEN